MSYATSNPPYLVVAAVAGGFVGGSTATGGNTWAYRSSDPISSVVGSSYFSNGYALNMRKYDTVMVLDTVTTKATWAFISAVTTTPGGGATATAYST